MAKKFVVVDLETTGNSPKKGDRIIQFAAVVIENGKITEEFSSLVNPLQPIPAFIEELTGLRDSDVRDAPLFQEIAGKVSSLLKGAYFVAHNVLFDLGFLQEELLMAGEEAFSGPVIDTVELARFMEPEADSYKLADLAEKEGLSHDRPHQADSDAYVTAELFLLYLDRIGKLPEKVLNQLASLANGLKSDLNLLLHAIALGKTPEANLPDTLVTVNGIVLKKQFETIIFDKDGANHLIYPFSVEEKLGLIRNSAASLEPRTGQFEMMDEVFHSFENGTHALIEAGTGIGKSLGYLLPAAYFAKANQTRVVISTHTIQLQQQLLEKEIPLLERIVPFPVKSALLKGRNNYISLGKFAKSLEEENDNYDTALAKMQILVWLTRTVHGDKDELNLSSGGLLYWNTIRNEKDGLPVSIAWQEYDFYNRARKNAANADLLITNHALILSDLEADGAVLPEYNYAVLDEGHHFEKAAGMHFGVRVDYLGARLAIGHFGLFEQKQLFYKAEKAIRALPLREKVIPQLKLNELVAGTIVEMDEFFRLAVSYAARRGNKSPSKRLKVRISESRNRNEWEALKNAASRFSFCLKDLHSAANAMLSAVKGLNPKESSGLAGSLVAFLAEIEALRTSIGSFFTSGHGFVKWIETDLRASQNTTGLISAPVSVANEISDEFFMVKKSVVLTSATLTVNNSFRFSLDGLGIDPSYVNLLSIPSPFDYRENVKLFISTDLPEINSVPQGEYIAEIAGRIISICDAARGRLLVLFTSHDMLKKTYELVKESGLLSEYALIAQGITGGSRSRLTRSFQKYEKAVLFGTNSFWEGIDIPGEGLSCLIVVRLPFSPPDEPFTKAKCELIEQRGGRPFSEYSLPEAVLRFKQGFGRLIRTGTDRGAIVVFDKRLGESSYGKAFLDSIPPVSIKKAGIVEVIDEIERWL
ncbi:ATP-dependent helicase DinG [Neobacillus piezotolerans]|uniref:3'-5' exonuclease DinG n=1 Tax=Neobacillus piezotolerans TaxID=2259171 RepID=A0A3D8GQ14_9BACI|nr:ATP-dependent DNA helicase DinG [Neobacillus piezotolerans]RDU36372.1 ATP-dependent helicase DinG [Neobacillus piezotolerans]